MHIVVIGGVAAGLKAAAKARRCDPNARITVIEKGSVISYGACGMPYYLSGEVAELGRLMQTAAGVVRGVDYFKQTKNIDVWIETLVLGIDRVAKTVKVRKLQTAEEVEVVYDKLVIATGSTPLKPSLPGVDLKNIYQFWQPDDALVIKQGLAAGKFRQAVVVGAGLVGMEVAEALKKQQLKVTVVEMKNHIFPAFLDAEMADMVEKHISAQGIEFLPGEQVLNFQEAKNVGSANKQGEVAAVVTNKRVLTADLVVLAIGAKPNVELARAAGLAIGASGAIAVDEYLRTSDPEIYAGGDCAENINLLSGKRIFAPMGSTANKHGRVIGENLCGGQSRFGGILNTVMVRTLALHVGATGLNEQTAKAAGYEYVTAVITGLDRPHYMPDAKKITVKLLAAVDSGKVLGLQAVGEGDVAKRIDVMAAALTLGATLADLFAIDLAYAPPYSSPIDLVAVAANAAMSKLKK